MMSLVVVFDVDGVLANFSDHLLAKIGSDKRIKDITSYDVFPMIEEWHGATVRHRAEQLCNDPLFWLTQPKVEGADRAIAMARQAGAQIWCATRPWLTCKEWEHCRRKWLQIEFDLPPSAMVSCANKSIVRGDVFIDDQPTHVQEWSAANPQGVALLFNAPYNQGFEWPERIDWQERLSRLGDHFAAFRGAPID